MDGMKVGMIVDGVSEVLTVSDDVIEPPPSMFNTIDTQYITGIARCGRSFDYLIGFSRSIIDKGKISFTGNCKSLLYQINTQAQIG